MARVSERGPAGATRDGRARAAQPAVHGPDRALRQVSVRSAAAIGCFQAPLGGRAAAMPAPTPHLGPPRALQAEALAAAYSTPQGGEVRRAFVRSGEAAVC